MEPSNAWPLGAKEKELILSMKTSLESGVYYDNKKKYSANIAKLNGLIKKGEKLKKPNQTKKLWLDKFREDIVNTYTRKNAELEKKRTYVLELAPLPADIDIEKLKPMVSSYLKSRVDFYRETKRSLYIEEEFSEWFIEKASGGEQIGKGSLAMNVQTGNNNGVDVFCVIMNKSGSNEKSLIQNFAKTGKDLDTLFKEKRFLEATELFMKDYKSKLENVIALKHMGDLYYLGFVSTTSEVFLVNFKINVANISSVGVEKATSSEKSIILKNFIPAEYGNVKLYKSKKRVELRLNNGALMNPNVVSIYKSEKPISDGSGDIVLSE